MPISAHRLDRMNSRITRELFQDNKPKAQLVDRTTGCDRFPKIVIILEWQWSANGCHADQTCIHHLTTDSNYLNLIASYPHEPTLRADSGSKK